METTMANEVYSTRDFLLEVHNVAVMQSILKAAQELEGDQQKALANALRIVAQELQVFDERIYEQFDLLMDRLNKLTDKNQL